jgi:hypothetical protein
MSRQIIDKDAAIAIAQEEVETKADLARTGLWTGNSKVTEAFPVHLDGIDDVCYWECKVTTDGKDAGYVLVNANKTDLLIPESAMEGPTLTERYRDRLGRGDFKVLRYDWLRSAAVDVRDDLRRSGRPEDSILDASGFKPEEDDAAAGRVASRSKVNIELVNKYRSLIRERGSSPTYSTDLMGTYYLESQTEPEDTDSAVARDYRHVKDELNNLLTCQPRHTPPWAQIQTSDGHSIGCGNTAWAILFAYWKQFRGKTGLFDGYNVDTTNSSAAPIAECMRQCAEYCDTYFMRTDDMAINWPRRMEGGIRYAETKGYPNSSVNRIQGTEFSKFDQVISQIREDKPAILMMSTKGAGHIANHYVVIEGADKTQMRRVSWGHWWDRDVDYLVNWGWGTSKPPTWIRVREWGINDGPVYGSFSIYLVNVA